MSIPASTARGRRTSARTDHGPTVSYVLPVRDCQQRVADDVMRTLDMLSDLVDATSELVVVDDGSRDATIEAIETLSQTYPQIRVVRHHRPRGMEAAGQSGLERSTGELVFIQETSGTVRSADMDRLLRLAKDESVVAARAESTTPPTHAPLLRRLKTWAGSAANVTGAPNGRPLPNAMPDRSSSAVNAGAAVQMIRRPHLNRLGTGGTTGASSGSMANAASVRRPKLTSQTIQTSRMERVSLY